MTLTRNYNSLSVFTANKDDVGFNESGNPFYDYSLNSPCGSWTGDKIKILSLPNKGRLYYNSTPLSTPTYANVTVGQEIMVRDLIDYKVLRFSAEGSFNDEFTESYLTNFTFERYCVSTAQNITVKVNLNMIDDKVASTNFYITDKVNAGLTVGSATYKLHVENEPFVGYANMVGQKNLPTKGAKVYNDIGALYIHTLNIPNGSGTGTISSTSNSITLPIGIYDCTIYLQETGTDTMNYDTLIDGAVSFGLTPVYSDVDVSRQAEAHLFIEKTETP